MVSVLSFVFEWFVLMPIYIVITVVMPICLLVAFAIGIFQEFRDALRGSKHSR